nr:hypothetical protein [uncultured Bacteroides sp.]
MTTKNKILQPETRIVMRSSIRLATYNPRTISDEAKKKLKANIKRVGMLGGIVWNEDTRNLVSGHQRISVMDEVNRYEPESKENDYEIKVEVVHMTEKQEKEQNLFMNNRSVQGDFDNEMLKDLLSDIDFDSAGFNEFDLESLGLDIPSLQDIEGVVDNTPAWSEDTEVNQLKRKVDTAFNKDRVVKEKDEDDRGAESYVCLTFSNRKAKESFMIKFGFDIGEQFIDGEEFSQIIERID